MSPVIDLWGSRTSVNVKPFLAFVPARPTTFFPPHAHHGHLATRRPAQAPISLASLLTADSSGCVSSAVPCCASVGPSVSSAEMTSVSPTDSSLVVTVKLLHVFGGIYLWEWATTLDFEWEVYTGQRPWRWSFGVYILCRTLALGGIITAFVGFSPMSSSFNCELWLRFLLVFSWFAIAFSSLLILLRGVAIWGRSWYVIVFTVGVWLVNFGMAIYSVQQGNAQWLPEERACNVTGTHRYRFGLMANLLSDVTLLLTMLLGVLNKRNATGLWRILYIQGLCWILIASFSEIPPVVLSFMNISEGWNLMFQVPHLVIIVIVATRVYRDLFQYISPSSSGASRTPPIRGGPMHRSRHQDVQVTVHKTIEVDVELSDRATRLARLDVDADTDAYTDADGQISTHGEREAKDMYFSL
ncbi:hypothetical protein FA95DRAFT_1320023 [Auriscalpium vulgare]|uniref:Uncharacterized protein n=1 Tax=Auriscalpium vulgare TaxID=40419 RepID=A0ACB8S8D4_9AGAM|nr:hypothetical protein FA95DRAFT_1320023 [Auriscalpium vulgare]